MLFGHTLTTVRRVYTQTCFWRLSNPSTKFCFLSLPQVHPQTANVERMLQEVTLPLRHGSAYILHTDNTRRRSIMWTSTVHRHTHYMCVSRVPSVWLRQMDCAEPAPHLRSSHPHRQVRGGRSPWDEVFSKELPRSWFSPASMCCSSCRTLRAAAMI